MYILLEQFFCGILLTFHDIHLKCCREATKQGLWKRDKLAVVILGMTRPNTASFFVMKMNCLLCFQIINIAMNFPIIGSAITLSHENNLLIIATETSHLI
jgi:hypothetical protein